MLIEAYQGYVGGGHESRENGCDGGEGVGLWLVEAKAVEVKEHV